MLLLSPTSLRPAYSLGHGGLFPLFLQKSMQSQKLAMAYFLEVTDNYPHHDEKDFKCKLIEVFFL